MTSKFKFEPLGATTSAKRNSGSFNVVWVEGNINLGVVRNAGTRGWAGIYAWRYASPTLASKNAVAEWMLTEYQESLSETAMSGT